MQLPSVVYILMEPIAATGMVLRSTPYARPIPHACIETTAVTTTPAPHAVAVTIGRNSAGSVAAGSKIRAARSCRTPSAVPRSSS